MSRKIVTQRELYQQMTKEELIELLLKEDNKHHKSFMD